MPGISLHEVKETNVETIADIVFVHGVGGDHRTTWRPDDLEGAYWPAWIAEDLPWARVWALDYPADATRWSEDASPMGVIDRSRNILDYLSASGIGDRTTLFIGYSMGGVLVKQLLFTAQSMRLPKWRGVIAYRSNPTPRRDLNH